jgi:sortase A
MRRLRVVAAALGELLVTAGLLVLLFVVWQLWWTDVVANREQAATVRALSREFLHDRTTVPRSPGEPVPTGRAFAILRIPRLGADFARPVLEGTSHDILDQGVGHYQGTAMPGGIGNVALAGHRTTYGRPFHDIDTLRAGDRIVLETRSGFAVYAVQRHVIVAPSQVDVIAPVPQHPGARPTQRWLTLTSCHPKYSASQRYVVFARLQATYSRAQGLPARTLTVPGSEL